MFHLQCERHLLQGVIHSLQAMCWKVAACMHVAGGLSVLPPPVSLKNLPLVLPS